jgi:MFS family permease
MMATQSLGSGLTQPFLMIYLHEVRGIGLATAGLLVMMIGVAGLLITVPCGYLIDRHGAWAVLMAGNAAMCGAAVILAIATTPAVAAAGLTLVGLNMGVSLPSKNVLVASSTTGRERRLMYALNFALLNLSWGLGGIIGGLYLDVHSPNTFVTIFLVDAALMVAAAAVMVGPLRGMRRAGVNLARRAGSGSLFSVLVAPGMLRLCALSFLVCFIGYGQLESGIPAFAREVSEISTRAVGIAFSINTLLIGALQFWVLRRIEGHRRTRVVVTFGGIWAAAWAILAMTGVAPGTVWAEAGFLLFVIVLAFGEMIIVPLLPVITNDIATDQDRGRFNSIQVGAFQTGAIAGPAFAGIVLQHALNSLYVSVMVAGCVAVMALALAWERSIEPRINGV